MDKKQINKMIWYEEYKTCSCTFIADKKEDLPGYCPRHFHDKRRRMKLPDNDFERGYAGTT